MHLHVKATGQGHCHWTAHLISPECARGLQVATVSVFPFRTERFFSMTFFVKPVRCPAGCESLCHGVITKHPKWLTGLQALHVTVTWRMGGHPSSPPPPPTPPHTTSSCLLRLMNVCLELYANDGGSRLLLLYRFLANMEVLNSLLWSCLSTWHCSFECNPTRMKNCLPLPLLPRPFLKPVWTTCVGLCTYKSSSVTISLWESLEIQRPEQFWVDLHIFSRIWQTVCVFSLRICI